MAAKTDPVWQIIIWLFISSGTLHLLIFLAPFTLLLLILTCSARMKCREPSETEQLLEKAVRCEGTVIKSELHPERTIRLNVFEANGTYYVINSHAGVMMPEKGQQTTLCILPQPLPPNDSLLTDETRTCILAEHADTFLSYLKANDTSRQKYQRLRTVFWVFQILTAVVTLIFIINFPTLCL